MSKDKGMKPRCEPKDMGKKTMPSGAPVPGNMDKILSGGASRPADKGK